MTNQQVETLKVLATDEDSGVRSGAVSRTPRGRFAAFTFGVKRAIFIV